MKHLRYSVSCDFFSTINEFSDYIDRQGGIGIDTINIELAPCVMCMFESVKVIFPKEFLTIGANFIMVSSGAEQIINKALKAGMKNNVFYKDIYKEVKTKVMTFAELHGQSEVIEDCLKIES